MLCLALASNGNLAQHGRLAPAEIEHLAVLQARHAATLAALGVGLSASCFGAGLLMLAPVVALFFDANAIHTAQEQGVDLAPLQRIVQDHVLTTGDGAFAEFRNRTGEWLIHAMPTDGFHSFILIAVIIAVLTILGSVGRYLHQIEIITITQHLLSPRVVLFVCEVHEIASGAVKLLRIDKVQPLQRRLALHIVVTLG